MATTPRELQLDEVQTQVWMDRIVRAYRGRMEHFERWVQLAEMYRGNYFTEYSLDDRVTAMLHLAAVRQMMAQLYQRNPSMSFRGLTVNGTMTARVMEQVMAQVRREMCITKPERKALFYALLYGTGIVKYSWNAQFHQELPVASKKISANAVSADMEGVTGSESDVILPQGAFTEHDSSVRIGMPHAKAIHPKDFLIDPEAQTLDEATYMIHKFTRRWIDVKRDTRYDDAARKMIQPGGQSRWWHSPERMHDEQAWMIDEVKADSALVTLYEVFDRTTQRVYVLSEQTPRPLLAQQYPFFGRKGPYRSLTFFPDDKSFWGIPYADTFTPQVQVINKLRTKMMDHLERYGNIKGAYLSDRIDRDTMREFAESQTGDMVPIKGGGQESINNLIQIFDYVPIAGDAWQLGELFKSDFQEISGISEAALGSGRGVQTATEASFIERQSGLRIDDLRSQLDQFLEDSTRAVNDLLRQFWNSSRVMRVVGNEGQMWDQLVTPDLVRGQYDVAIEAGSTERLDRNARMRQGIELLQTLASVQEALFAQGKMLDIEFLVKEILRNSELVKNVERVVVPVPQQPQPQQAQQPAQGVPDGQLPSPADVNGLDQVIQSQGSFQNGRQLSEAAA